MSRTQKLKGLAAASLRLKTFKRQSLTITYVKIIGRITT